MPFLATLLGTEHQSTISMFKDHGKKEDNPTDLFNPDNIVYPMTIDQLQQDLRKLVEEKNMLTYKPLLQVVC